MLAGLAEARRDEGLPDGELSTADWLSRFTKNESVHGIFRSMCGSVFAVGPDELPARVFLTYFTRKSAFKTFGFCPRGTVGIWESLAAAITAAGGQVWLGSEVALADHGGRPGHRCRHRPWRRTLAQVAARVVISDVGPGRHVAPARPGRVPADYADAVKRADRPCAMISVNFASTEPLLAAPGLLSFARTRRLCYAANFTATCPEMAPDGWHLYVGTAVPRPSVGDFDEDAETELLLADLREEIPGFDRAPDPVHGGDQGRLAAAAGRGGFRPAAGHARRQPVERRRRRSRSTPTAAPPPAPRRPSWSPPRSPRATRSAACGPGSRRGELRHRGDLGLAPVRQQGGRDQGQDHARDDVDGDRLPAESRAASTSRAAGPGRPAISEAAW